MLYGKIGILHQIRKQTELGRRQRDRHSRAAQHLIIEIQFQAPCSKDTARAGLRRFDPPAKSAQPRYE
jgi:hypothetical protein